MAGSRIKGITVEIDGNVTGLEKALKSVNSTIKTTQSQLKDVERLLKLDPSHTELLSQKQALLKDKIGATKEKLDALKQAQEQAKQQMESGDLGKDKYDALQREIIETEQELKNLAREAAEANTALNKIDAVGKKLESVGNKMSSVGSSMTRYVTAPIVALGTAAIKTTADFDESMSQVKAVSGATGEEFDKLREKAREMGAKTKFSASEAADAFNYMAMAGWKSGEMLDGIEGIMNLAAASGEDLATTSDIVTDALTAFGLKAKDSGHFADVLAAASSNANTNVSMLGESFKMCAPVCGSLGISAEDAAVALGLMANAGVKGSQAGSSLRTGLVNLSKPTKQMTEYMNKYNISLKTNEDGSVNLRETMVNLREKMSSLSETERAAALSAIFGKNSMAAWAAIVGASDEDFEKLASAIDGCDGAAEDMAATMQDNLNGQITILKSALQELAIQIGDALMPTIRNIVSKIQEFVLKLQQMDEGTRNTILRIAAFAAAIGPVLLVVGKLTTGVGKGLQAISSLGKGILTFVNQAKLGVGAGGKLATALAGIGPVGWAIIVVVAALTAAFVHLWKNNEEFRAKVTAIWESVKAKFSAMAEKITNLLNSLGFSFSDLGEAISAAWDWLCNALEPLVTAVIQSIGDSIESIIDIVGGVIQIVVGLIKGFKDGDWTAFLSGISDLFTGVINALLIPFRAVFSLFGVEIEKFDGDWGKLWEGIKSFFVSIWEAIKNFFVNVWNGITGAVSTAVDAVSTAISTAWNAVKTFFESIWNGIKSFFEGIWKGITGAVSTATETVVTVVSTAWNTVSGIFSTVWNGISGFFGGVWDGISGKVSTATSAVSDTVSNVWNGVSTFFSDTWNGISGTFSGAWDGIKNTVDTVQSSLKTGIETAWTSVSDFVGTTVSNIQSGVSEKWEAMKSGIETTMGTVSSVLSEKWEGIKTGIGETMEGIKTDLSTSWDTAKTAVTNMVTGMKVGIINAFSAIKSNVSTAVDNITNGLSSGFEAAKNTVSSIFGNIKTAISTALNSAKSTVSNAINSIRNKFNFSWSLPKLKMPHVSISGKFSLNPLSVPHFSISWYKKAMEDGMIMNGPTIFGMKGNQLLAGGEAGSETIVGTNSLMGMIRDAVKSMVTDTTINYGGVNINVYARENQDVRALADEIEYRINNNLMRRRAAIGV